MQKTILITGATDGIGLEVAKTLVSQGHNVLVHGRNATKMARIEAILADLKRDSACIESYLADFSDMQSVKSLADTIIQKHHKLEILINNAGIFRTSAAITKDNLDIRFAVNTLAPYLLTKELLPLMDENSRVINLSSAAQSPVDLDALAGRIKLNDEFAAYAQSKLAITAWSRHLALSLGSNAPVIISVNPGSLLATKMVKEGFGMAGKDIGIGADILIRAALSDEFSSATGKYFDNDIGRFAEPHSDALDLSKTKKLIDAIEEVLTGLE